jgi:hypothetical protein
VLTVCKVAEVYSKDKEFLDTLNSGGIRQSFYRILNVPILKEIFHCLDCEVDLDDIFNSPAAVLYSTFYCNMSDYVLQHRVKPGNQRSKLNDEKLFEYFRKLAHEKCFADLDVDDIPLRPRRPSNKKRIHKHQNVPLSEEDDAFKTFGPPIGFKPRLSKKANATGQVSDGIVEV